MFFPSPLMLLVIKCSLLSIFCRWLWLASHCSFCVFLVFCCFKEWEVNGKTNRFPKMLMLILLCVYISFDPQGCGVPFLTELFGGGWYEWWWTIEIPGYFVFLHRKLFVFHEAQAVWVSWWGSQALTTLGRYPAHLWWNSWCPCLGVCSSSHFIKHPVQPPSASQSGCWWLRA